MPYNARKGGIPVKKLLCMLCVCLFLSLPCLASAMTQEEYEQQVHDLFAGTSDADLQNLFQAVQFELVSRGYKFDFDESHQAASVAKEEPEQKEMTVPPGTYDIGIDIPEGAYTLTTTAVAISLTVTDIWDNYVTGHFLTPSNSVGKLKLEDGQSIEIVGGSVIFKPYAGLGF